MEHGKAERTAVAPGDLPPASDPSPVDPLKSLLKRLTDNGVKADTPLAQAAKAAVDKKAYRQAEEILAGRAATSDEANLLGLAYAHLAYKPLDLALWQRAADAFAFAAAVESASEEAVERATKNGEEIERELAIRGRPEL